MSFFLSNVRQQELIFELVFFALCLQVFANVVCSSRIEYYLYYTDHTHIIHTLQLCNYAHGVPSLTPPSFSLSLVQLNLISRNF